MACILIYYKGKTIIILWNTNVFRLIVMLYKKNLTFNCEPTLPTLLKSNS